MAVYYKPQSPIQSGEDFIYPITTADQIMKSDNSRRLEQAGLIVADNSTSLGGVAAKDYALKTDTAPDSSKLGGKAPEYYLQPRNLLDNSDFRNPVNQRGKTSYTAQEYTIDRWYSNNTNKTITLSNTGITLSTGSTFFQKLDLIDALAGKTITAAVCFADGTIAAKSGISTNNGAYTSIIDVTQNNLRIRVYEGTDGYIRFQFETNANIKLQWAALYEGSYTADTLPPYVSKGYAAELTACNSAPVDLGGGYGGGSLQAYPVGSIYMSVNSTSPASLFGGTWEQIKDRFLLAAGSTYAAGSTGGEATHYHGITHNNAYAELLITQSGKLIQYQNEGAKWTTNQEASLGVTRSNVTQSITGAAGVSGKTESNNNMPPYLAVYMWKRVE